jgi:hypothetical protein
METLLLFRPEEFRFREASWTRMVEAWCIGVDPESGVIGVATKDKKLNFWRQTPNCSAVQVPSVTRSQSYDFGIYNYSASVVVG